MVTGKIVLAVEDEESDALLLELAAEAANIPHRLLVLRDGQELIDYLTRQKRFEDETQFPWPRLMLLDLKMPTIDGFQVLTWLNEHLEIPRVPVLVFSASACEADKTKALKLGATDFLSKPSQFRVLVEMMRHVCEKWLVERSPQPHTQVPECCVSPSKEPDQQSAGYLVPSASSGASH
jgi:DNA-binding response OmpR family regulator